MMSKSLQLPDGELAKLAELQREEMLRMKLADPPVPSFEGVPELVLRKYKPGKQKQVQAILEKQPFGELERLVTQKLLDVVKQVAKEDLESEDCSDWCPDRATEATKTYGGPSSSSWTRMCSTCR